MYSKVKKMTMDNVIESSNTTQNMQINNNKKVNIANRVDVIPSNILTNKSIRKKFDWKIYKWTVKNFAINAEYKAIRHFNKYAKPGTIIYKKYLQNLYKIPPEFDEAVYLKYTNSQKNIFSLEDLYIYFTTNGYREYPLNDQYFKIYYNIDFNLFDTDAYFKRYKNEIEPFMYSDDNDDETIDWETGSQMSTITSFSQVSTSSVRTTGTMGTMLSSFVDNINDHRNGNVMSREERKNQYELDEYNKWKDNLYNWHKDLSSENTKIYKFYNLNNRRYPLDEKYLKIKYGITNSLFSSKIYAKRYNIDINSNNIYTIDKIYNVYIKNNNLDDLYFRLYYDIPNELNINIFIERYSELFLNNNNFDRLTNETDKNNYVYMLFNSLKNDKEFKFLDDYYFKIMYKIPDIFDVDTYLKRHPNIKNEILDKDLTNVNKYVTINKVDKYLYENYYKSYQNIYLIDELYYKIYFQIPDYIDYDIFLKIYPEIIDLADLKSNDYIFKLSDFAKESVTMENKFLFYKYYNKNRWNLSDNYFNLFYITKYDLFNLDIETYVKSYEELNLNIENIEYDKDEEKHKYYENYYSSINEYLKDNPINDVYYKIKYNVPDDFDSDLYVKRYIEIIPHLDGLEKYTSKYNEVIYNYMNSRNKGLDEKYYRLKYDIPEDFHCNSYLKRYPEICDELTDFEENSLEYYVKIYELSNTLLKFFKLDKEYYKIRNNISDLLNENILLAYKQKYNVTYDMNYDNEIEGYLKEGVNKIDILDDKYLKLFFNIPDDFNEDLFYLQNIENIDNKELSINVNKNEIKIKIYCYYVSHDTNIEYINNNFNNIIKKEKEIQSIDMIKKIDHCLNNCDQFINTRIKINQNLINGFYDKKVTLIDIYELFNNDKMIENIDIKEIITSEHKNNESRVIDNINYLKNLNVSLNDKVVNNFYLQDFIKDYINTNNLNYHIKINNINIDKTFINNKLRSEYYNLYSTYCKQFNILNKYNYEKLELHSQSSNVNIVYIYFAYDTKLLTKTNFVNSLQYLPNNSKIYFVTNNDEYNNFISIDNVEIVILENTSKSLQLIVKELAINSDYVFSWDTQYVMKDDHIFIDNEINNERILISNSNNNKYKNTGILRKMNYLLHTNEKIDNNNDISLASNFRKHHKKNIIL